MQNFQKRVHYIRIEVGSGFRAEVCNNFFSFPGAAVGPFARKGVPYIDDGEDSGKQGNVFSLESLRIAGSVPLFMVTPGDGKRGKKEFYGREQVMCIFGMLVHDCPFFMGERSGFEEN